MKVIWLDDFREPAHFLYEDMNCNKETFKNKYFLNIEEEYTRYGEVINRK